MNKIISTSKYKKNIILLIIISVFLILATVFFISISKRKDHFFNKNYKIREASDNEKNQEFFKEEETSYDESSSESKETEFQEKISGDFELLRYNEEIDRKYPWYRKLPIEKEGYRILWEINTETFRIRLKISEDSSKEEKETLTKQALKDIESITGRSYKDYPYYVVYIQEND